ncbi:Uncharacterized protein TCM_013418 [Theobroma cacao]|uniref:Uncharacterized protein n=1 Tax=Theobroma cacao TaxID=3641 RepID=A0A061G3H4_THECC|nr:Uncharacterized protein TCM_013418 [Theobroma cacao]
MNPLPCNNNPGGPLSSDSHNYGSLDDVGRHRKNQVVATTYNNLWPSHVYTVEMSLTANWDWLRLDSNHALVSFMLND